MAVSGLYALALLAAPVPAQTTTPYEFFQTYVAQLATFEELRKKAAQEVEGIGMDSNQSIFGCIHSGTRYDLEASSAAAMMDGMHLKAQFGGQGFESLPHQIAQVYRLRQAFMRQITSICSAFAEGPKAGVDYKSLTAKMPMLRAHIEDLDKTLFASGALAFATLISDRPDKQGHASHLVISCAERQTLLTQIKDEFGIGLDQKDPSSGVAQAQLFRDKLIEYKCAEEPR